MGAEAHHNRRVTFKSENEKCLEDWVQWIRRATKIAWNFREKFGIPDWVDEIALRKFRWAGHVARREDGKWTKALLEWTVEGCRSHGRPVTRWSDSLNKFFSKLAGRRVGNAYWMHVAKDRDEWIKLEKEYVKYNEVRNR